MSEMPPDPFPANDGRYDVPFGAIPAEQMQDAEVTVATGCVVLAAMVPTVAGGQHPALVLRFGKPAGGFYPPVMLLLEEDQLAQFPQLVAQAVAHTLKVTRGE